jgi:dTDP-4-amino-4,6-dideoxygalactose transaminase
MSFQCPGPEPGIPYEDLGRLNAPFFEELKERFAQTLESGWYILGENVERFEVEWAQYIGSKHAVGVASGLDALTIALRALELPPNSEVIVPSNTYIATILSIFLCGLTPVLVEPKIDTYNIDPARLEDHLTKNTAAVMVVHLYGKPCDMGQITAFTQRYGLRLIEDCAQSHGAQFRGKMTGVFGDFGAFSFYPTKNLGALGDAGALVTDDEELARRARTMRNYGSLNKYYNEVIGMNSRLDEIQAGFLSVKLPKLNYINAHKQRLARLYQAELNPQFIKPVLEPDVVDVYHIYSIRHPLRDLLRDYLRSHGIGTEIHYPVPPHAQQALQGKLRQPASVFPLAEEIHRTILSLPISFCHTEAEIYRVIEVANAFTGFA